MRHVQLETLVLHAVDRVLRRGKSEDSRFEFKRVLPTGNAAARRIAGHANAARGEPIVWIVGMDEDSGEFLPDQTDLANWWGAVSAHFEDVVPELLDLRVKIDEKHSVLALSFETNRAPYLVRNERFSTPNGGAVEWEVPWRDATRTRSARRSDLLRILAPASRVPDVEQLSCRAELTGRTDSEPAYLRLRLAFYAVPLSPEPVVIPFHRCACSIMGSSIDSRFPLKIQHVQPQTVQSTDTLGAAYQVAVNPRIIFTQSDVTLMVPSILNLVAAETLPPGHAIWNAEVLTGVAELQIVGAAGAAKIGFRLELSAKGGRDMLRAWDAPG